MNSPTLASIVRRLRTERGWTIYRLAQESGVNKTSLGGIERGTREMKLATALAIARACGVSLSVFDGITKENGR